MKLNKGNGENKKSLFNKTKANKLSSFKLLVDINSNKVRFCDIDFLIKFKNSVRESLYTIQETISPSEEKIPQNLNFLDFVPKEYIPGLICLKNRLIDFYENKDPKLVLFNSPKAGDLSSEILIYYAKIVAKCENIRILLVDCNLQSPTLHRKFNLPQNDGLADYLGAKMSLKKIIKETEFAKIFVITSGINKCNPTFLLTLEYFADFIRAIRSKFDLILFDSPAYRKFSDAFILSRYMTHVLLIFSGNRDTWENAKDIREELEKLGVSILGLKVNTTPNRREI